MMITPMKSETWEEMRNFLMDIDMKQEDRVLIADYVGRLCAEEWAHGVSAGIGHSERIKENDG